MKATMGSAISRLNLSALPRPGGQGFDWDAGNIASTLFEGIKSAGIAAGGKVAGAFDKGTGMLAAQGIAVNNHMAMAYKGPGAFREHEFAFNFFPKKYQDAEDIRLIIADFKSGMLPRMKGETISKARGKLSKPFFRSPRHWEIEFYMPGKKEKNPYLLDIKKSVITSMTVNHDPNSIVSLHADGTPVQTTLSLTFREIEFPISDDTDSPHAVTAQKNAKEEEGGEEEEIHPWDPVI